ncbi:MAG: ROK family protein [Oscillospiraceae bacterium]|nr:ROK family protein [Oscillospiraceae bacterium]
MSSPASQLVAALPSDLKLSNRMQILELFKTGGAYPASQIAQQIGVSRQTVMKAIQFFVRKGLIVSTGKAASTSVGGKRAELFSLSPDKYLLCIALWPDSLHITLLNFLFETVDVISLRQALPPSAGTAMDTIGRIACDMLRHNHIPQERLCGVSISTSGIVDYRSNILKYNSLSPIWGQNVPLAEYLRPYFAPGTPISLENVAKVTGRAFLHEPTLRDKRVLVVFSSWGGVCGCFLEKDRILNGKDSLIGEIGHMTLMPDDPEQCGCGGYGCFERLVSNERLRQNAARSLPDHPESLLNSLSIPELTVETLFSVCGHGDAFARELVSLLAKYFAMAMRNLTLSFDPDVVVLQGEYAAACDFFCEQFHQYLHQFQYYPERGSFTLQLDRRPIQELNVRGGYTLLLDHFFSDATLYE